MLFVENLFKVLKKNKVNFFSGVPDSILKNFSLYLEKKKLKNIVAANEGSAVSIGIGSFLEKKKDFLRIFTKFRTRECCKSFSFYSS